MTPQLRRAHRYIWYTLAVLLPLGWLAAIRAIPDSVWQTPIRTTQPEPLPVLVQSKQSGDLVFNLREDSTGARRQIECWISKPLDEPNATLILEGQPPAALGLLGARGAWRFALDSLHAQQHPLRLRLEDQIQHRVLRKFQFE